MLFTKQYERMIIMYLSIKNKGKRCYSKNCFYSCHGKSRAIENAGGIYCDQGVRRRVSDGQLDYRYIFCDDWNQRCSRYFESEKLKRT
jgi:hypothetical protein